MTISLRPHQQRILDRMLAYDKGQVIVPTGGGKTLTMILDTQRRHDVINNGTTTVVVAPRILLAEQLCSEFMDCLLYTSPSPRDQRGSRMPSSA